MTTFQDSHSVLVSCGGEVGGDLREAVVIPWGQVKSLKGEFLCDEEAAAAVVEAFDRHGVSLPIDYEHSTLKPTGRAEAAGWIERLYSIPGVGIKALVRWTAEAKETIRADKYRYLSPVLWIRAADRRAFELHSVGLTNKPAIPGMERVAASTRDVQDVELKAMATQGDMQEAQALGAKLRKLLGLGDDASVVDTLKLAIEKIEKLAESGEETGEEDKAVANATREILGLPTDAGRSAVVLAMRTHGGGDGAELAAMKAAEVDRVAQNKVDAYVQANKLNPNDKTAMAAAVDLAKSDPATLDLIMRNVGPYATPGRTTAPPGPGSRAHAIACAAREHQGNAELGKSCSLKAFINEELRSRSLAPMSIEEEREFVAV